MLFVCFLWQGKGFWKPTAQYSAKHVLILSSMLKRYGKHSLLCVHDDNFEIPPNYVDNNGASILIKKIQMPKNVSELPDYLPKLWVWSSEFQSIVKERFAFIDLDVVLLGDVSSLLSGKEPVILWDSAKHEPYNTSLFALEPGFHNEVWDSYTPEKLKVARSKARYWTGDQSWVAHVLGNNLPTFGEKDGVLRYHRNLHSQKPPDNALAMFLCGPKSPDTEIEHSDWIKDKWC